MNGKVSTSSIFHDASGGTAIKVISLSSAESYASGKVASVSGTCDGTSVVIDLTDVGYTMADGTTVGWSSVSDIKRILFSASPEGVVSGSTQLGSLKISSSDGNVSVTELPRYIGGSGGGSLTATLSVQRISSLGQDTASFSVVVVGN
jgi:hypothetical protein